MDQIFWNHDKVLKTFDKPVCDQWSGYDDEGLKSHVTAETALVKVTNDWLLASNTGLTVLMLTFETMDHNTPLQRLNEWCQNIGIIYNWLHIKLYHIVYCEQQWQNSETTDPCSISVRVRTTLQSLTPVFTPPPNNNLIWYLQTDQTCDYRSGPWQQRSWGQRATD